MMDIKEFAYSFKEPGIFAAWTASIILIASLAWLLTGSIRSDFMISAVNRTDFYSRERVYLERSIPSRELRGSAARMGSWFTVQGSRHSALVFTLFAQGNFLPCMALVSPEGKVEEILPLSAHAENVLKRIPNGVLVLYEQRIEEAVK